MTIHSTYTETIPLTGYVTVNKTKKGTISKIKCDFYKLFWIFLIGSVVGFIVETIWCLIHNGSFECRSSMIIGPFTAVYGLGALVLYIGTKLFTGKNKILHIFIFGTVSGTVVEYLCSLFQEMFCGSVSWDYTGQLFNIGGRVCLLYSVFWGLLSILWFIAVQSAFEKLISKIPARIYKQLTIWLAVFMVLDILVSIVAVTRWGMRIDGIPAGNILASTIDKLFPNEFMSAIYPNMLW